MKNSLLWRTDDCLMQNSECSLRDLISHREDFWCSLLFPNNREFVALFRLSRELFSVGSN